MISTQQKAPSNSKFKCVDLDFVSGLYQDGEGRLWIVLKAGEINNDLIDCDYCSEEHGEGLICVDNREKMCLACFNKTFGMNANA